MIVQSVHKAGSLRVEALAELAGVSAVTIRRDLVDLEARGAIRRTAGGAARTMKEGEPVPFGVRFAEDRERKMSLATAAAELVEDYESVIIDNGTTAYAVALELAGRPITALALSLHAAVALGGRPGARVIVPGGAVESDTLALTGIEAIDTVRGMRADVLILGTCATAPDGSLTSAFYEDSLIKRACIQSASRRVLVTTADKVDRAANFRFGSAGEITQLVTTRDAHPDLLAMFRAEGTEVVLV